MQPPRPIAHPDAITAPTASPVHAGIINRKAWAMRWEDRAESLRLAREVLSLRTQDERPGPSAALAARTIAWQARWRGDLDGAADFGARALEVLAETPRMAGPLADLHAIFADLYLARGRSDLARASVEGGFAALGAEEAPETRIDLLCAQARILERSRHVKEAADTLMNAMSIAAGPEIPRVHHELARLYEADGRLQEALSHAMRALSGARAQANRVILPHALASVAACHRQSEATDRARTYIAEGLEIAEAEGDRRAELNLLYQRALIDAEAGASGEALEAAQKGALIAAELTFPRWARRFGRLLAETHETLGNTAEALRAYKHLYHLVEDDRS
ncbi:hypothetical protein ATO8_04101 [Roseivivax marinus]|jgi:tetratricopeptide (TPR) repeat protein|uniref:MalT-like TPR region domain-containing protein n=1 Tax=Roseivivax marinus TaxID=1379903 RepID=W4HMV7_9RHOB|nr:hypothetical protein [Roseivivax marinus]ETW14044.1 hypothetical protein ATO8_04101 [Roseivivax marinus]UMA63684.1 hypothetical protein LVO79_11635 [Roseivivax marinus]SEK94194.1 hypothetical protein SAMN05444413_104229 [Roseivivax marinus]